MARRDRADSMHPVAKLLVAGALASLLLTPCAGAAEKTVCTITVNSADEKDAFRRYLPEDKYRFVELVERGRPDWLASACRSGVRCDVLVISGHYDGGNEFFSEHVEASEFLPVAELERVSCSDSCPGLFSRAEGGLPLRLQHAEPARRRRARRPRSCAVSCATGCAPPTRSGSRARCNAGHGESSRDRMRLVFKDVPVIYGFSSVAPLGPQAAATLSRYFQAGGAATSAAAASAVGCSAQFAPNSMAVTRGHDRRRIRRPRCGATCASSPTTGCRDAQKLALHPSAPATADGRGQDVPRPHRGLRGDARRSDRQDAGGGAGARGHRARPRRARALPRFRARRRAADGARAHARRSRTRSAGCRRTELRGELARMLDELLARKARRRAEVDLACTLNEGRELDGARQSHGAGSRSTTSAHAAVRACLGSAEGHARTLEALVEPARGRRRDRAGLSAPPADHRRRRAAQVAAGIARMDGREAQVRALAVARRGIACPTREPGRADAPVPGRRSSTVQTAIAGILIRADYRSIASPRARADAARAPAEVRQRRRHDRRADPRACSCLEQAARDDRPSRLARMHPLAPACPVQH